MIIAAYYIDRSWRHSPCWTVANTLKQAKIIAKKWALESNCYTAIKTTNNKGEEKTILRYNEKGEFL